MTGESGGGFSLDRYPREIVLRNGARLVLRPMVRQDADRLWEFFQRIPAQDRMFFRQDVSHLDTVQRWADTLDYRRILPILAWDGDRVAGDATLHRRVSGWKQQVGVVRVQIAPEYRHQGLGTAMIRELRHLGEKAGLRYLKAEVIGVQEAALAAFEKLGFARAVVYPDFVNDQRGRLHDLVVLLYAMPPDRNG